MKITLALLALAAAVIAAPVPQGSYDGYGSYDDVAPPANNDYGSYGDYDNVPTPPVENPQPPAGGYGAYGDYGAYKRDEAKAVEEEA